MRVLWVIDVIEFCESAGLRIEAGSLGLQRRREGL
jgi:hypothetical protein